MTSTDRISELPDSMLHHIMSFMKARAAVRTCVLSKRWRRLSASLQHLYFNITEFRDRKELYPGEYREKLHNFIHRMLQERDNIDVHTFYMDDYYLDCDEDGAHVREWIGYAIDHNARVIDIPMHDWSNLPQSIYTCTSLEELHVDSEDTPLPAIHPVSVSLPRLRHLDLCSVDHEFLKLVLMHCPALEVLNLAYCRSIDLRGIPFYKLRKLSINCCAVFCGVGKFSAPSLESFVFEGTVSMLKIMGIDTMPSLAYAQICVMEDGDVSLHNGNCNILMRALSNAHKLEFRGRETTIRDMLKEELQNCPTFYNLVELIVSGCAICHSNMIARMLESSPYLQKLTIRHGESFYHRNMNNCEGTTIKGAVFKCKYLDTIEIELRSSHSALKSLIEDLVESLKGGNNSFKIILLIYKYAWRPIDDFQAFCSSLAQENPQINLSYKLT